MAGSVIAVAVVASAFGEGGVVNGGFGGGEAVVCEGVGV